MDRSLPLMAGTGEEGKKYHYHHYKTSTFFLNSFEVKQNRHEGDSRGHV